VLLLPLDLSVSLDGSSDSFELVYSIYYPVVLFFVGFLNPVAMFFYESDEAESTGKRVLWSVLFAFAGTALWSAFIFISYVWVGVYDSPSGE
jgi:prepilin signal peptidase PulO-like enzyme (type II secretory pathway)